MLFTSMCVWLCVCVGVRGVKAGLSLKKKGLVTPTETKFHGDALCFMVKTWARHKTTEALLNNGWQLAAVGGGWLAVGGGWWWAAVGGWWLLGAVLKRNKNGS